MVFKKSLTLNNYLKTEILIDFDGLFSELLAPHIMTFHSILISFVYLHLSSLLPLSLKSLFCSPSISLVSPIFFSTFVIPLYTFTSFHIFIFVFVMLFSTLSAPEHYNWKNIK